MATSMYPDLDGTPRAWTETVPGNLDDMAPGPVLGAFLSSVDTTRISGHDRVLVMRARQRMASHYAALVLSDMEAVSEVFTDAARDEYDRADRLEHAAGEIRAALNLTRRSADNELLFALDLVQRHPNVYEALCAGHIDARRARVIIDGISHLDDGAAESVVDLVLAAASNLTTGQLRAKVRSACIEVEPDDARDRYEAALENRRISHQPGENGTAHLYAMDLPPDAVAAATNRINEIAKTLRSPTESRTMDQLCADVFLDLLNGNPTVRTDRTGTVDIRVDLTTLMDLDNRPGDLAGYGPVVADIARKVTAKSHDSEWRYSVTDPTTGRVLNTGPTRRRPTAGQRRYLESVHPTCVFPGCRTPATECDMDHRKEYSKGGRTVTSNLTPLCRHDHVLRHAAGWTYEELPNGGIEWTSPLGHTYTVDPSDDGRSPP